MSVETRFSDIGARAKVRPLSVRTRQWNPDWLPRAVASPLALPRIDIRRDRKGEYFDLAVPAGVEMEVIDANAAARHLVLLARLPGGDKARYLAGHDERHWFVAAVPESYPATTVEEAKRALQPDAIKDRTVGLNGTRRIARHNEAYRRQGEWFFVPEPDFEPGPKDIILRNEPLRRDARSKPHVVAEAVRSGGETRYIPSTTNRGFTHNRARAAEIDAALGSRPAMTREQMSPLADRFPEVLWRSVLVNPTMYVRGPVRHSDHSTVVLKGWHRVVMNAESLARASAHIAFIDQAMPNGHSHTGQTKESSQAAYVDYGRLVHDAVTAEGEAKTPHEVLSARAETLYVQANELSQMADGLRRQADWKEIEASEIRALADEFVAALARLASVDGDPEVVLD